MSNFTVRNLPAATHQRIRLLARAQGCSAEAMVRTLLTRAVATDAAHNLGTQLAQIGSAAHGNIQTGNLQTGNFQTANSQIDTALDINDFLHRDAVNHPPMNIGA